MQSDDPLANDRTQFMPRPGGRGPQPATPASAPPPPPLNVPAEPLAPGQAAGL
ncbi:type VI secretion system protein TssL, partial [Pseudomonas mosselii]|nr:type VI secretion system protein TssL [Pseudomonas mosselii]